jgi:hypothetical protein
LGASFTRILLRSTDHFANAFVLGSDEVHNAHKVTQDIGRALGGRCVRKLFLLENFDRFPRFVRRSLFVFQRALQIHLGQQIVGIEFQET